MVFGAVLPITTPVPMIESKRRNNMDKVEEVAQSTTGKVKKVKRFTDEERAAMKERAKELKAGARRADGERDVLAKIAEMPEPDRAMAERLHSLITATVPTLSAREPARWL
jgi:hypothetical protein